eukprot:gb/GEZJ01002386.1/.p1 GENE.gb/GEZJ01002386.1/~~gb/GEZJ01002386.1/.p1  ORF type:complete len:775 (-),score=95.15 gb/GEZJ01002386.1/:324-2648(-)
MNGTPYNNTTEEYEDLRPTIGEEDYDLFPSGSRQPIPEEELLQTTQPLKHGHEHLGEAYYDAFANRKNSEERGGDSREEENLAMGGGNEEEADEGNTDAGIECTGPKEAMPQEERQSESDSDPTTDDEEGEEGNGAHEPSSFPTEEDSGTASGYHPTGQYQYDRATVRKGEEVGKNDAAEETTQPEPVDRRTGKDSVEGALATPQLPWESQQSPSHSRQRFKGRKNVEMQVDLYGNLTPATKELERLEANKKEFGEAQTVKVNNSASLSEFSVRLDEKVAEGNADVRPYTSQIATAASSCAFGNILQAPSDGLCEEKTPLKIDDFFISSPLRPVATPSAVSQGQQVVVSSSTTQQCRAPSSTLPNLVAPQASQLAPQVCFPQDVTHHCAATARLQVAGNPHAPALFRIQQRATSNDIVAPAPSSARDLGVRPLPMKSKASGDRQRKTCERVAQGISAATDGRPVFKQDGRRVRVIKTPRREASHAQPSRPPLYPTQPPSADHVSPASPIPSQGLEESDHQMLVKRGQPGSSAIHTELERLLETFRSPLHRPPHESASTRVVTPVPEERQVPAPASPAIPSSENENRTTRGHESPTGEQTSQGEGADIVAASPMTPATAGRKSVKRKHELTAEEKQEKKRIRAMRNRQSAEKSRRRRKAYAMSLESNVLDLRGKSQEWRQSYIRGLRRLSEMQQDIKQLHGDQHQIPTPAMQNVVGVVGNMVGRCSYTFKKEEPEVELGDIGEDRRRRSRGRGAQSVPARRAGQSRRDGRGGRGG